MKTSESAGMTAGGGVVRSEPRCEARVYVKGRGSHQCPFHGLHKHRTQAGDTLTLCAVHRLMLMRRERLGSDEEVAERWREG